MARRSGSRRASAAVLALALAACPSRARPQPTTTSSTARPTGTLTIAYPWEPPTLTDPSTPSKDLHGLIESGFVLRAWHRGLDMIFDAPSSAKLATIRVVFVPDPTSALKLFRNGDVDALGPYQAPGWARRTSSLHFAVDTFWTTDLRMGARGPLADVRVRRALYASIDRARIGRGLVGADGAPADGYGYDLAAAKRGLEKAGWRGSGIRRRAGNRLIVTLALVENDDLTAVVARAIQFQALRAGFDIELVPLRADVFWRDWLPGSSMQAGLVTGPGSGAASVFSARVSVSYRPDRTCMSARSSGSTFGGAEGWSTSRCT